MWDVGIEVEPSHPADKNIVGVGKIVLACLIFAACGSKRYPPVEELDGALIKRGRYLATIGVCEACHTPPRVPAVAPTNPSEVLNELQLRANPDWVQYLDAQRRMAGGVPFIVRFGPDSHAVVYSRNISPDRDTGIGNWTVEDIVKLLRTGQSKNGQVLFLFAPHTFFKDLTAKDATAIAHYLKSLSPVRHEVPQDTPLPFPTTPMQPNDSIVDAPEGRTRARSEYLMSAIVGCKECHSYHDEKGVLQEFVGGDPRDPFIGVFRLGPDLPLRATEKGFATFPYPGFAILYGANLTRFGKKGDMANVNPRAIANAIKSGVMPSPDDDGRPDLIEHVMMWQFYRHMKDDDALAIADHLKSLDYVVHDIGPRLVYFGVDWEAMFTKIFGGPPSPADKAAFGK